MPSERFTKDRRVRRPAEFKRVFDLSLRTKGRYLTLLVAPTTTGVPRLGIVASRKLGDAVRRNRAKRLMRELFRRTQGVRTGAGFDVVVIPRRELFDAEYATLEADFRLAITRGAARLSPPPDAAS